ncbi:hypothetical protein RJ640_026895 [Escallonia rubra]|uniref:Small auxin up regulated protein n=1 Tax=Escallonia rubra TaxID=112253 RepID=A0AA88R6W4_9ASTE|nr:hypothetical protein RJ640_026895 [Escallonia rubra]
MVSLMTLVKMAKMWRNIAAINRKRISLPSNNKDVEVDSNGTTVADKGHFVVYSDDGRRFVIPLVYLNNEVLRQLLKMSEEEFGLPGKSPSPGQLRTITLITLVKVARKWRKLAVIRRKRISLPRNKEDVEVNHNGTPFVADKGHFVVYFDDGRLVVIPLPYLNNKVLRQLLIMAEEEFGLPGHGPITMPSDAFMVMVEYIISMIRGGLAEDLEIALLMSICKSRCLSSSSLHQGKTNQQLLVH